jgi:hypothetical protein
MELRSLTPVLGGLLESDVPIRFVRLHSDLPIDEVRHRISMLVNERPGFWNRFFGGWGWSKTDFYFAGTVSATTFRIMRIIRYQNSFLPVVRGWLAPAPVGTRVRLLMTLHPLVAVFMAFWCSSMAIAAYGAIVTKGFRAIPVVPGVMLLFGVALVGAGFIPEAYKAEQAIKECIASRPTRG